MPLTSGYLIHAIPATGGGSITIQGPAVPGAKGDPGKIRLESNGQYAGPERTYTNLKGRVRIEDNPDDDAKDVYISDLYEPSQLVSELLGKADSSGLTPNTLYAFTVPGQAAYVFHCWAVSDEVLSPLCIRLKPEDKSVALGVFDFGTLELSGIGGGSIVDLSDYYTRGQIDSILQDYLSAGALAPYALSEDVNSAFSNVQEWIDDLGNVIAAIRQLPDPTGQDGNFLTVSAGAPTWTPFPTGSVSKIYRGRIRIPSNTNVADVVYFYRSEASDISIRATQDPYPRDAVVSDGTFINFFIEIPGLPFDGGMTSTYDTYLNNVYAKLSSVAFLNDETRLPVGFYFIYDYGRACFYVSGNVPSGAVVVDFFFEIEDKN